MLLNGYCAKKGTRMQKNRLGLFVQLDLQLYKPMESVPSRYGDTITTDNLFAVHCGKYENESSKNYFSEPFGPMKQ